MMILLIIIIIITMQDVRPGAGDHGAVVVDPLVVDPPAVYNIYIYTHICIERERDR